MTRETGQGLTALVRHKDNIGDLLDELVADGKIVKWALKFNTLPDDYFYLPTGCFSIYDCDSRESMRQLMFIRSYLGINKQIVDNDDYIRWLTENESKLLELKNLKEVKSLSDNDNDNYIGSICSNCGEMSNHDEVDEDICIHCGKQNGSWHHIYE